MLKSYITRIVAEYLRGKLQYCESCKHVVPGKFIKEVSKGFNTVFKYENLETLYFCPSCAPAYDKVIDGRYYKTDVEVDESGKVIKKN